MDQIAGELRRADPDRYLSTLYAPESKRADLVALYAFNAEIASIRDRIHEPLPGEVRLQWWRDVIAAGTVETASGHPLADALIQAICRHQLPRAAFEHYLEARIFDLYDDPMPSTGDLEGYCGETASAILQLAAMILSEDTGLLHANAAGHAGCAQAIAGILRLLPMHRARRQCYVPADLLNAAGSTSDALFSGADRPAIGRVVDAMVSLGRGHLAAFRREVNDLPAQSQPAFLPVALVGAYLDAVAKAGAAAIDAPVEIAGWRRQWIMVRTAWRGWPAF